MRKMSKLAFSGVVAAAALVAAACGSGGGSGNPYGQAATASTNRPVAQAPASPAPAAGARSAPTSVAVAASRIGPLIVDGSGRTLYVFDRDIPDTSTCYNDCAKAWPPLLTTGSPAPGPNVNGADLGTTMRRDGAAQVTYHGHPLYLFIGDKQPGDTTGQGLDAFGARWYAVSASGTEITGY